MDKSERQEINIRLTGERGNDAMMTRLEAWAKKRGITITSAARIMIVRGLDQEGKPNG